ncbi:MAG: hypothetical protein CMC98_05755 [Flavobacteriales bacterium]|nr:hypothetical protein [Flavobacteriales bacterium]|tara:strand:- start:1692 stop:2474 length:783 start_codon:yes stop_codon:yes gene_type:complete
MKEQINFPTKLNLSTTELNNLMFKSVEMLTSLSSAFNANGVIIENYLNDEDIQAFMEEETPVVRYKKVQQAFEMIFALKEYLENDIVTSLGNVVCCLNILIDNKATKSLLCKEGKDSNSLRKRCYNALETLSANAIKDTLGFTHEAIIDNFKEHLLPLKKANHHSMEVILSLLAKLSQGLNPDKLSKADAVALTKLNEIHAEYSKALYDEQQIQMNKRAEQIQKEKQELIEDIKKNQYLTNQASEVVKTLAIKNLRSKKV